ncbi:MAG: uracil-DNA glycosylase [Thermoplasmata archaeon]|uniref:Type-5 uracil-DNA glycosylase n=1 Tax=Candidatus Sysuiplasma superficiale TaxID=2823368 RepID=A0A8J7YYN5_9ARCH|nr:uracil-DNA glycosylase [Candidatus Sysuiplasma superficiale]MBX8644811.1 uracil-DNA glycosylase [Candidatus Sysuiplasma superficiale]
MRKVKRFAEWTYWSKPVPGFGDPDAELVIIGLAPAAHGGNRTGRVFTGDLSAKFLVSCLYEAGFSNQPRSENIDDGLRLLNAYMLAAVRCVPPNNIPTREEALNCFPFLKREMRLLRKTRAVLLLGKFAFDSYIRFLKEEFGCEVSGMRFRHGAVYSVKGQPKMYVSYHPSPRNTNTGTLTRTMFIELLNRVKSEW